VHNNVVAVKKLPVNDRSTFDRESNVLQHLRKERHTHPHLITLLATYEQDEHLYLILPWAEVDLHHYWRSIYPTPSSDDATLSTWLRQQCCGLLTAVSHIHKYKTFSGTSIMYETAWSAPRAKPAQSRRPSDGSVGRNSQTLFGRHGDIKPANILWFPDPTSATNRGTLKISDLGTALFSVDPRVSIRDRDTIPNSQPYQSPECILPGGEISSQCDVWALGCVFLEFICWYYGGRQLLELFEHDRGYYHESTSFFSIHRDENSQSFPAEVKQPVKKVSSYYIHTVEQN
jgi:serine/threonine protein kinase